MKTIGQRNAAVIRRRRDAGQTMVEYVIVFAVLVAVVVALTGLFLAERRSAARTVDLVASEYP